MSPVEAIGLGLLLWCIFSVPAALIAGNVIRKFGEQAPADDAQPGRELTVEELCRLHEGLSIPGEK